MIILKKEKKNGCGIYLLGLLTKGPEVLEGVVGVESEEDDLGVIGLDGVVTRVGPLISVGLDITLLWLFTNLGELYEDGMLLVDVDVDGVVLSPSSCPLSEVMEVLLAFSVSSSGMPSSLDLVLECFPPF